MRDEKLQKLLDEFVSKRCKDALMEDAEYMEMELNGEDSDILQARAEVLCYKRCARDLKYIFDNLD